MDIDTLIRERHSVRKYYDHPVEEDKLAILSARIAEINSTHGVHFQMVTEDPEAFSNFILHYGRLEAYNYIALIGNKKDATLDEKCGYFGEELVLKMQELGLNSCWLALTYSKKSLKVSIAKDERLVVIIAFGYGMNQGVGHKKKTPQEVSNLAADSPAWFAKGVEYALLAPTAVNQQKFYFTLDGDKVKLKAGHGPCTKVDLGIVKYHFELGAGKENFLWEE